MRSRILLAWTLLGLTACGDDEPSAADGGRDSGRSDAIQTEDRATSRGGSGGQRSGTGGRSGSSGGTSIADAGPKDAGKPDATKDDDAGGRDTQSVTIRFQAKFGDRALKCGESYELASVPGARVSPADFRFFVQEVRLTTASGKEEPVVFDERAPVQTRDVAVIDFTDDAGNCGAGTTELNTTITGRIAPDNYTGISFVSGVPDSLNHQDLVEAKPPLDDATTNWGWTLGYRFSLSAIAIEPGDLGDADGGSALEAGVSFVHVGAGGCSGAPSSGYACTRPNRSRIVLSSFDSVENVIVADLSKVFDQLDLTKPLECHGLSKPECEPAGAALGVDVANGGARKEQRVFRVE